ncbi:prolyl oligopeptidase family serine peptidase [Actinomycetospora lutea]|uniref:alpha/beta hydrolase n=1 Tax=Actinomycetospora lutea TaxID=663604 RepID=UPI002366ECE7|nr:prolyl oligopeptidase family serine peptidase [Actinomycetospora lutea]MDD7941392.1 prolyl oligopeptidase family serine peptidase [Actinomycetospora lutea]
MTARAEALRAPGVEVRGAPPGTAALAVVLLHGRDQDPAWMHEHVVGRLAPRLPDGAITWVLPAAPGRTWYAGRVHDPPGETLAERDRAADVVDGLADALAAHGHDARSTVLAGFSQGACLVADHLLRRRRRWAGALVWTGAAAGPPGTDRTPPADDPRPLDGLPVLATNGDADPWVPLAATEEMVAALRGRGAEVELRVQPGRDHEVADDELDAAAALLRRLAATR